MYLLYTPVVRRVKDGAGKCADALLLLLLDTIDSASLATGRLALIK